jgi:anaerobic magnesium-protoporphyrin IX monomethyl ester cyclase
MGKNMSVDCVFTRYTGPVRYFDQFFPDLGLAYLSSALKQVGYTCELYDLDLPENSAKGLLDYVRRHKPAILAVKLLRPGFPSLVEIVSEAKKISPTTLVIGGGPHARVCQETILEFTNAFDALIIGEGERAIVQVAEVARGERDLGDVENVLFRNGNGRLVKKPVSLIHNLDELPPPDWGLHDLERYFPILLISARRGCPFSCAFCFNFSRISRKRTLSSLQQEILGSIERHGACLFGLVDPLPDIRLTDELCGWLIDSKIATRWTSFGRIKYSDWLFEKMACAGWVSLFFGIESGSEKILKRMNKLYTVEDIRRTIGVAQKAGIKSIGGFIIGFPGEDESTLTETFALSRELPLDGITFSPFALGPGSPVAENPEAYGVKPHGDWMRTYTCSGQSIRDIPYFDIAGEDNVSLLNRLNPLVNNAYKNFRQSQLSDDAEYAELLASVMEGTSAEDILRETDALLDSEDFRGWNALLSRMWRATENIK